MVDKAGRVVIRRSTDATGRFAVSVAAGTYVLRTGADGAKLPQCPDIELTLPRQAQVPVLIQCDSGMR